MRWGRTLSLAVIVVGAAACVQTDIIPSAFNGGALDSARGDPHHAPRDLQASIVSRLVRQELGDAYFAQGPTTLPYRVSSWMRYGYADCSAFMTAVEAFRDREPDAHRVGMERSRSTTA